MTPDHRLVVSKQRPGTFEIKTKHNSDSSVWQANTEGKW